MSTPLIDATEMYLRTVWELIEEDVPPMRARLVERLGVSAPAVSETVARLADEGLLSLDEKRRIVFTKEGQALAASVMRKHRLAECLLINVVGIEWHKAHTEACKWEHVISDNVEHKIFDILDGPKISPYGNPVPVSEEPEIWRNLKNVRLAARSPGFGVVARISEALQGNEELMKSLDEAGILPGANVSLYKTEDGVEVAGDNGQVFLTEAQAEMIWVSIVK